VRTRGDQRLFAVDKDVKEKRWRAGELELSGTIGSVIYRNDETGYAVLRLTAEDGEAYTVTGCIPFAAPGERLLVRGSWSKHPVHGEQFKAEAAERRLPADAGAIYDYLASGAIKGIGPATALLIVDAFGAESMDVIGRSPEKLATLEASISKGPAPLRKISGGRPA
jgi:exodeoxyribonuclease V alpha subunit